jgi:hypothetical protein
MPNSLDSSLIFTQSWPLGQGGGRINAGGYQRGHKKTERTVPMGRLGHSRDRRGKGVEDRDNLGSGERNKVESLPPLLGTEGAT